jgi:hypothetical protein
MSLRVGSTRVIAGSRLKCVEPPAGLGHNRGTNHCRLDSESRKCLILKRRDAGAVDQARLESVSLLIPFPLSLFPFHYGRATAWFSRNLAAQVRVFVRYRSPSRTLGSISVFSSHSFQVVTTTQSARRSIAACH